MILDCNKYRLSLPFIQYLIKDKSQKETLASISSISVASAVPIIIVCCFIGEMIGFTDELKVILKRLMHFYNIKEIKNCKGEYL